jgi:hypothetical protein
MNLETHEGRIIDLVTPGDIAPAVAGLTDIDEAFIILSDGDETYVQAAGTVSDEFIVEYRSGGAGEHYRGDRCVSADDLVSLLVEYLRRTPDWSSALTWYLLDANTA